MFKLTISAAMICFFCFAISTQASERVALIIGNSDYQHAGRLNNPKNDAILANKALQSLGFRTFLETDREFNVLKQDLIDFKKMSEGAEIALIYFAGHGIQIEQSNYLLAVDTHTEDVDGAINSAIPMEMFIEAFAASAKTKLLLLDACRNNPFAESVRSINQEATRGLAKINHEVTDLMVVYAAQPNRVALDGSGENSPFLTAVVNSLTTKGDVKLSDALIEITNRVKTSTNNKQIPYVEGSLSNHVIFNHSLPEPIFASNSEELQCQGQASEFSIGEYPEDYAELKKNIQQIVISNTSIEPINICPVNNGIQVNGPYNVQFSCDQILNTEDEGVGYYYPDQTGEDRHLWFYHSTETPAATAEMGVYKKDTEELWMTTGWNICN